MKKASEASRPVTAWQSPNGPWITSRHPTLWKSGHPGTDGLFASPPLRQPGNHEPTDAPHPPQGFKAHGFASPLFSGFALSRMKGVAIQARREDLPPKPPQKLTASFACTNSRSRFGLEQIIPTWHT